jgi:hypothetical protein
MRTTESEIDAVYTVPLVDVLAGRRIAVDVVLDPIARHDCSANPGTSRMVARAHAERIALEQAPPGFELAEMTP